MGFGASSSGGARGMGGSGGAFTGKSGLGLTTGKTWHGNTAFGPAGGMASGFATRGASGQLSNFRNLDGSPKYSGPPQRSAAPSVSPRPVAPSQALPAAVPKPVPNIVPAAVPIPRAPGMAQYGMSPFAHFASLNKRDYGRISPTMNSLSPYSPHGFMGRPTLGQVIGGRYGGNTGSFMGGFGNPTLGTPGLGNLMSRYGY